MGSASHEFVKPIPIFGAIIMYIERPTCMAHGLARRACRSRQDMYSAFASTRAAYLEVCGRVPT